MLHGNGASETIHVPLFFWLWRICRIDGFLRRLDRISRAIKRQELLPHTIGGDSSIINHHAVLCRAIARIIKGSKSRW
ncbi:hypothetical protein WN55_09551 [Dufourea novaeangliae]|uniref:Uncharacterized protein n=1 Tax=Dufourea novaeangliae TaxID=178035 RepID=A0A154NYV7_DUFNO|nr:hypothetical protein WN55_09551 [Dufourea novaeangliae]